MEIVRKFLQTRRNSNVIFQQTDKQVIRKRNGRNGRKTWQTILQIVVYLKIAQNETNLSRSFGIPVLYIYIDSETVQYLNNVKPSLYNQ